MARRLKHPFDEYHTSIEDPGLTFTDFLDTMPPIGRQATIDFRRQIVALPMLRITFADIRKIAWIITDEETCERI